MPGMWGAPLVQVPRGIVGRAGYGGMNLSDPIARPDPYVEYERRSLRRLLEADIHAGGKAKWSALRALYSDPALLDDYNPYPIDWLPVFTPIEYDAWWSIRYYGLPFYPQFPVGRFFVDFGDPNRSIAIECDGARWHSATRDEARDLALQGLGWKVFRIPGWRCVKGAGDEEGADEIVRGICRNYYPECRGRWGVDA